MSIGVRILADAGEYFVAAKKDGREQFKQDSAWYHPEKALGRARDILAGSTDEVHGHRLVKKLQEVEAENNGLRAEIAKLREALENVKLRAVPLADAQVIALEALAKIRGEE